ncbi:RPAP1-like protein [Stachybotrys elegans]|uniref:RPAP1-like protein n=1 Tax=Stachybotrys elegans TaxID=80388 RepID=A0A8K0SXB2_9HYPO|nr:RPAP1-like protein [Stachybotrys elegans]
MDLIGEIVEHDLSNKKPVEFSDIPATTSGFPQHKRRWKSSAFKQQRANRENEKAKSSFVDGPGHDGQAATFEEKERKRIDEENRRKLDSMSPQEIAQAQEDLLNGMNPALIQRLLRRANIDESDTSLPGEAPSAEIPKQRAPEITVEDASKPEEPPANTPKATDSAPVGKDGAAGFDEDQAPKEIPLDLEPDVALPKSTHFPAPPKLPDLDPSDPDFLATLHEKYFPDLPADPSKLAWMAPIPTEDSIADKESPYYPHPEISVSSLRFDFRGRFLSPRVSRSIPTSKGLHHHGLAPEAAGYTIAELAHLARSAVPAQRCMAFQTLGRILYRLGKGEWGTSEYDPIGMGIWASVKEGRVLDSLAEAAMVEGGHQGSRAYATEALWLYEKGGWKEKFKGR